MDHRIHNLVVQYAIMKYIRRNGGSSLFQLTNGLPYSKAEIHQNLAYLKTKERLYSSVQTIGNFNQIIYNILLTE